MAGDQPVREHRYENAEEAAAAVPGADVRYLPLRRPTADWRMTEVSRPGPLAHRTLHEIAGIA